MKLFQTAARVFGLVMLIGCSGTSPLAPTPSANANRPDAVLAQQPAPAEQPRITLSEAPDTATLVKASIVIDSERHASLSVKATRGLTLDVDLRSEGYVPGDFCYYNPECGPGTTFELTGNWVGMAVSGTAEYHGTSYPIGYEQNSCGISVYTAGSFISPPQAETATVTVPVTLTGGFTCGQSDLPRVNLEATGTATVSLRWSSAWASWRMVGAKFEFGRGN